MCSSWNKAQVDFKRFSAAATAWLLLHCWKPPPSKSPAPGHSALALAGPGPGPGPTVGTALTNSQLERTLPKKGIKNIWSGWENRVCPLKWILIHVTRILFTDLAFSTWLAVGSPREHIFTRKSSFQSFVQSQRTFWILESGTFWNCVEISRISHDISVPQANSPLSRVNPGSIFRWGLIFIFGGLVNFFFKIWFQKWGLWSLFTLGELNQNHKTKK
jgi:hypothetical protein